jgi:hypothetical protein
VCNAGLPFDGARAVVKYADLGAAALVTPRALCRAAGPARELPLGRRARDVAAGARLWARARQRQSQLRVAPVLECFHRHALLLGVLWRLSRNVHGAQRRGARATAALCMATARAQVAVPAQDTTPALAGCALTPVVSASRRKPQSGDHILLPFQAVPPQRTSLWLGARIAALECCCGCRAAPPL